ncbi:hypothetical protein AQUCO_03100036v1 [Aquilegia coerulea]|uniref:Uncharacterized protein n=1 Tax=Aquilegia coerulea TaxID=218851 RepID=A0A2G5D0F8_AQUCA|nr:hypothetical protein AQUCO_03100036v1 [Aquilegia coerulea]
MAAAKKFDFSNLNMDVDDIAVGDCGYSSDLSGDGPSQYIAESPKDSKRKRSSEDVKINSLAEGSLQGEGVAVVSSATPSQMHVPDAAPEIFKGIFEFDGRSLTVADSAMNNPEVALALLRGSVMPLDKETVNKLDNREAHAGFFQHMVAVSFFSFF